MSTRIVIQLDRNSERRWSRKDYGTTRSRCRKRTRRTSFYPDFVNLDFSVEQQRKGGVTMAIASGGGEVEWAAKLLGGDPLDAVKFLADERLEIRDAYPQDRDIMVDALALDKRCLPVIKKMVFQHGAKAIAVASSYGEGDAQEFLDSPKADWLWDFASAHGLLVHIHPPMSSVGSKHLLQYRMIESVGRPFDTTVSAARIINSGVFDRYPRLQVLLVHMGGYLTSVLGRLDFNWRLNCHGVANPPENKVIRANRRPSDYMRTNVYVDTMGFSEIGMRAAIAMCGVDRVVFGSDYGPVPVSPQEHIDIVGAVAALAKAIQPAIARQAPYVGDLGSRYREEPGVQNGDRPHLVAPGRALELARAPIDSRLPDMDANGIDVQTVSYTHPIRAAPASEAAYLVRAANDRLAEAVAYHPSRFGGFSTLPWQDTNAAIRELERSSGELGLTATMLIGHPGEDVFLDDLRYAPVLTKLEELQVPVYIHPGPPLAAVQRPYYGGLDKEVTARLSLYGWGWHNEAGIQVVRLILSGALDRYPNLRIISGHWGEMAPFFLQRLDDALPPGATGLSRSVSQTYRDQVFVTPSGMLNLPHFRFIHEVVGADRIMFSVDYPYLTMAGAREWLEKLSISDDDRAAIAHRNAERLLRLPPSSTPGRRPDPD